MSEKVEKVIVDNIFNHKKRDLTHFGYFWFGFVMFNATFNNNLDISWRQFYWFWWRKQQDPEKVNSETVIVDTVPNRYDANYYSVTHILYVKYTDNMIILSHALFEFKQSLKMPKG